jgi:uncharacterized protein (TIGR02118 family)
MEWWMFKVFAYLKKRDDMSTEEFRDYYENQHIPLVLKFISMPKVYKRNYLIRGDEFNVEDPSIDFDCITEAVWDDRAEFTEFINNVNRDEIRLDEEKFLDRDRLRVYVVEEGVSAA